MAEDIGPPRGQHALYGLANLIRHHPRERIEQACEQVLNLSPPS
jgi:hypothetical protein